MPELSDHSVIDYFGKGHWLSSIQQKMSLKARRRMFDLWMKFWKPNRSIQGARLIDVGSTPDMEWIDSNCMIPWFMSLGIDVSLYSVEEIRHLAQVFPGVTVLERNDSEKSLPGRDQEFDCVVASAVIEHVGSRDSQVRFVQECGRIGKFLFITTPNRGHWLEFHTKLPMIHWLPRKFHSAILRLLGKEFWSLESNLRLLDRSELLSIAKESLGNSFRISIHTIANLGMASNLILLAERVNK